MPLTCDQELALLLAGTVGLPSPSPATGTVDVVTADSGDPLRASDLYLEITHKVGARMTLVRTVRLDDVRVVRAVWPDHSTGPKAPTFKAAREVKALALDRALLAGTAGPWLSEAVVSVLESAPVLMRVEVALTAAESADYYPPIGGSGRTAGGGLKVDRNGTNGHGKSHFLKASTEGDESSAYEPDDSDFSFNPCTPGPSPFDPCTPGPTSLEPWTPDLKSYPDTQG